MGGKFTVKPVKDYRAGYPKKGFFRKSFVVAVPLKFFSFLIIGMLFFITVPGCDEQELSGDAVPDHDVETTDSPDHEYSDIDEIDGLPQPECTVNEDCEEGYYCDTTTQTCIEELTGDAVAECLVNEDCEEGFYCDTTTNTCEEEMLGDAVPECLTDEDCEEGFYCETEGYFCVEEMSGVDEPEIIVDEDSAVSDEEVPDEELGGIAPPELNK